MQLSDSVEAARAGACFLLPPFKLPVCQCVCVLANVYVYVRAFRVAAGFMMLSLRVIATNKLIVHVVVVVVIATALCGPSIVVRFVDDGLAVCYQTRSSKLQLHSHKATTRS